jgi:hypothetical protein
MMPEELLTEAEQEITAGVSPPAAKDQDQTVINPLKVCV